MGSIKLVCSVCGRPITPETRKSFKGQKNLCPSCYRALVQEQEDYEKDFTVLAEYIKDLFALTELPPDWVLQIENWTNKDKEDKKTLYGIQATLYYYYEIEGNAPDPEHGLWAVKYYYQAAAQYFEQQELVKQNNAQVDLTPSSRTIIMTPPKNETRKPKYNIEDLLS